jgi:hypothetical protein
LADDFRRGQVAIEALSSGGTERAIQRTAGLRGNAQSAAVGFGNEYRFDGVAVADIKKKLARTVVRQLVAKSRRWRDGGNTA